jgi:hypothetical protein
MHATGQALEVGAPQEQTQIPAPRKRPEPPSRWARGPAFESSGPDARPRKRWKRRNPLGDTPFYPAPFALYDLGLARYMKATEFKRYQTLLRLGNYDFGHDIIQADLRELEKLDGIAPRTGRRINTRLGEYGLVKVLPTHPRTYILLRPKSWRAPEPHGPRIAQKEPLIVRECDLPSCA